MTTKELLYDLFQEVLARLDKDATTSQNKIRELNLSDQKDAAEYEQKVFNALVRTENDIIGIIDRVEEDYFHEFSIIDVD